MICFHSGMHQVAAASGNISPVLNNSNQELKLGKVAETLLLYDVANTC